MNKSISSDCTFFEPTLEEHIRFSLARMELLRITVDRIDPFTTTVITFGGILEEAIEHYNHVDPPLSKLPNFLLVDWQGENESWKEITDKYNIHIFPAHYLKNLCPAQCCLYARPSQRHWEKGCYSPLVEYCASLGLTSGYQIDAVVTAPLWHRPADPAFIEKRFSDICTVYNAMADDDSKETFLRAMKTIATGDPGYLPLSPYPQYNHPSVKAQRGDVLYEGGLDSGHTTIAFSRQVSNAGRIYAFEALPSQIPALKKNTKNYDNIYIEALGLWSGPGIFYIEDAGGGSRMVSSPSPKSQICHSIDLDTYIAQHSERCDIIKLDIEGAEEECLKGAMHTLRHYRPKLQISLYHQLSHYLDIPLLLIKENLDYSIYCGHHKAWYSETVLYAISSHRNYYPPSVNFRRTHTKRVSIVIPTYNNAATLERCLDSVLLQQIPDMEIIVVDDASTDKTPEIISNYVQRYPQIIHSIRFSENKGSGPARNAGMDISTGDYLTFVDSDDMLAEDFITTALRVMEEEQADIVACDMVVVHENPWKENLWGVEPGSWSGKKSLENFLFKKTGCYATYAKLYRTRFIHRYSIKYGPTRIHQDIFFSVQAFYHSQKTIVIPNVGYYRYIRSNSTSLQFHGEKHIDSFVRLVGFITGFFHAHGLDTASPMYKFAIRVTYGWDRKKIIQAIHEAELNGKIDTWLTEDRLRDLGASQEALCLILTDYAILYCYRKGLSPHLPSENVDWQTTAAQPNPPQTYKAYGNADASSTQPPLLSVIVSNYNKAPYLKKCLNSILNQSMRDFELIIVDDASTDTSYSLLQDYADKHECIRLYRMDYNSMQGVCRNIAMDHARGTYLTFIDIGDWLEKDFFAHGIHLMCEEQPDMGILAVTMVEKEDLQYIMQPKLWYAEGNGACQALINGDIPEGIYGKFYNKKWLFDYSIKFPEYTDHEDTIFLLQALQTTAYCVTSQITGYNHLQIPYFSCHLKHYSYRQIFTGWTYLSLYGEIIFSCGLSQHDDHTICFIEESLLPILYAFYMATEHIPFTDEIHKICTAPGLLRAVLKGFSDCAASAPIPQGLLPLMPQRQPHFAEHAVFDSPLISVLIPTYNQEACISRCLDSILHQSLRSIEIIIIDDASTDQTLAICKSYSQKDPRIHVFSNPINSGQGISRNKALEKAKGKYITYVDSDDYILPDFLLNGCSILERHPQVDFVHFSYSRRNLSGAVEKWECDEDALRNGLEVLDLYCRGKIKSYAAWSKIYRHSFLTKNEIFFPKYFFEDMSFLQQAYLYAKNILFINKQGYVNVITPHAASTMNPIKSTHRHIDGIGNIAKNITHFFEKNSSLGIEHLLIPRLFAVFWLYKKNISYISSYYKLPISPFTDEDITHLKSAPDFLRIILEDYARMYAQHTNYKAKLPQDDLDPLCEKRSPAQELLPYSFHPVEQNSVQLSIIVSAYNVSQYLNKCLDSILQQYTDNIEIIIVEDCSDKDNTFEICQEYAQKYSCIRLFRTPWNSGLGTVRNLAINQTRGNYITFVDGDDWLEPYFFQRAFIDLTKYDNPNIIVYNAIRNFNNTIINTELPDGVFSGLEMVHDHVTDKYKRWESWGILYKKIYIKNINAQFEKKYYEDEIFIIKCYILSDKVYTSSYVAYNYVHRKDNSSIMTNQIKSRKYFFSTINNIHIMHEFIYTILKTNGHIDLYDKIMASYCQKKHHKENLLYYIYSCKELGLPSPLTDHVLEALTCSDAFLRAILMDHAVLSQKPLPQQKTSVPSHPSPQVAAAPRPQPVKNAPGRESDRQHLCPHIPDIGMGSFFERALWKVAPKRAAVYALRRSHCFDINYYKAMYPDVAKAGVDPVLHYVYFGAKEGRNPAPWFNTSLYVADNPDVNAAGVNPFYHYIRYGHAENRRPAA